MTRSAWAAAVVLLLASACASDAVPGDTAGVRTPAPAAAGLGAVADDGRRRTPVDVDRLADEVAHPDELRAVLADAGFARAAQRSFAGGTGRPFSRVRRPGASPSAMRPVRPRSWRGSPTTRPPRSSRPKRIDPAGVPDGVVVFRHLPDGCCHNDVPVFLAAWQRGSSVLYLHAGGRRANARAFVELISTYDQEV